ncbi:hypothetical protein [Pseudoxanthomonas beigongshangi]|jgi:hypothetical protein
MEKSTYRFSERYIRSKVRGPIYGAIVFIAFTAIFTGGMAIGGEWHPAISAGLFLVASMFLLRKNLKLSREAAEDLPKVAIEISDNSLCFVEPGASHIIPMDSITSIVVDRRRQEPRVVYLQRTAGPTVQLEGLARFEQLTQQLAKAIGTSKLRELGWWQFPPR